MGGKTKNQPKQRTAKEVKESETKAMNKASLRLIATILGIVSTLAYQTYHNIDNDLQNNGIEGAVLSNEQLHPQCNVNPKAWAHSFSTDEPTPLSSFKKSHNDSLFWGHFRPSIYWGLRTRSWPTMGAVGLIWSTPKTEADLPLNGNKRPSSQDRVFIRHDCKEGNGIEPFGFDQHDGRGYASQHLTDTKAGVQFHTVFAKPQLLETSPQVPKHPLKNQVDLNINQFEWISRISGKPISTVKKSKPISLLLYAGFDCDGLVKSDQCIHLPSSNVNNERNGLSVQYSQYGGLLISPQSQLEPHESTSGASDNAKSKVMDWELNILPPVGEAYSQHIENNDDVSPQFRWQCIDSKFKMADIENVVSSHLSKATLRSKKTIVKVEDEPFFNNSCSSSSSSMIAILVTLKTNIPFSIDMNMFNTQNEHHHHSTSLMNNDQLKVNVDVNGEIIQHEKHEQEEKLKTLNWRTWMDDVFVQYSEKFEERFERVWQLKAKGFSSSHIKGGQFAMSNLLGGIGYFAGKLQLKAPQDLPEMGEGTVSSFPMALFSGSPSRSFFPRGFAWDEGFHQQLILKWDVQLGSDILSHWLQTLHQQQDGECGGWLPREQALGAEAMKRVPAEFLPQDISVANPPTLLILLDALTKMSSSSTSDDLDQNTKDWLQTELIPSLFPRAAAWLEWMMQSQLSTKRVVTNQDKDDDGLGSLFRWRGRDPNEGKLMTTTFASGLDDYPRALFPSQNESHVDLLCWICNGMDLLSKVANNLILNINTNDFMKLKLEKAQLKYSTLKNEFTKSLMDHHWSNEHVGFYDTGMSYPMKMHNIDTSLMLNSKSKNKIKKLHSMFFAKIGKDVMVSCSNDKGETKIVAVPYDYESSDMTRQSDLKQRKGCPLEFPKFNWPLGAPEGGLLIQNAVVAPLKAARSIDMNNGDDDVVASYQHVTHVGYVSLFPMLLTVLNPSIHNDDENKLISILNLIFDENVLWSPFGIRSLNKQDLFYAQENAPGDAPYWRGAIWMPINFLTLRALQHYSKHDGVKTDTQQFCLEIYTQLRQNLLDNLLSQWDEHESFWEHYDDTTGTGLRSHPFTGWTSLILNVMAEQFSV